MELCNQLPGNKHSFPAHKRNFEKLIICWAIKKVLNTEGSIPYRTYCEQNPIQFRKQQQNGEKNPHVFRNWIHASANNS